MPIDYKQIYNNLLDDLQNQQVRYPSTLDFPYLLNTENGSWGSDVMLPAPMTLPTEEVMLTRPTGLPRVATTENLGTIKPEGIFEHIDNQMKNTGSLKYTPKLSVNQKVNGYLKSNPGVNMAVQAAANVVGNVANRAITDGFHGKAADVANTVLSTAGGLVGGVIGGPFGAALGTVAGNVLGGVANRAIGYKTNDENIATVKGNIAKQKAIGNQLQITNDNSTLVNAYNSASPLQFSKRDLGRDGWFSHKIEDMEKLFHNRQNYTTGLMNHGLVTGEKRANIMNDDLTKKYNTVTYAYGGLLDYMNDMPAVNYDFMNSYLTSRNEKNNNSNKLTSPVAGLPNAFAIGGDLQTHGADWSTGSSHIDAGGTHEENPNQGVQVGVDNQGTPNLVEEGEVIYNDYVYSQRITLDNEAKERFNISKKKEITYADEAKVLEKEISERPNDPISKAGYDAQMQALAEEQERQKAEMQAQEAQEMFAQLSPEEQVALMQQMAGGQQEAPMDEQQAAQEQMAQEQMTAEQGMPQEAMMQGQPMMPQEGIVPEGMPMGNMGAYGGLFNTFGYGGNLFETGGDKNKPLRAGNKNPHFIEDHEVRGWLRQNLDFISEKLGNNPTEDELRELSHALAAIFNSDPLYYNEYNRPTKVRSLFSKGDPTPRGYHYDELINTMLSSASNKRSAEKLFNLLASKGLNRETAFNLAFASERQYNSNPEIKREYEAYRQRLVTNAKNAKKPVSVKYLGHNGVKYNTMEEANASFHKNEQKSTAKAGNNKASTGQKFISFDGNVWNTQKEMIERNTAIYKENPDLAAELMGVYVSNRQASKSDSEISKLLKDAYANKRTEKKQSNDSKAQKDVSNKNGVWYSLDGTYYNTKQEATKHNLKLKEENPELVEVLQKAKEEGQKLIANNELSHGDLATILKNMYSMSKEREEYLNNNSLFNIDNYSDVYGPASVDSGNASYSNLGTPYSDGYLGNTGLGNTAVQAGNQPTAAPATPVEPPKPLSPYQTVLNALGIHTQDDWNKWAEDNEIKGELSEENINELLGDETFRKALAKSDPILAHALSNNYDFGNYKPEAPDELSFDFEHGGWGKEDYAAWDGSTDAAWLEAKEKGWIKEGDDSKTIAAKLMETDAYKRGTKWLQDNKDNRLKYLQAILKSEKAPKAAKDYARKWVNDKGWIDENKSGYDEIFGKVRTTHPGTYWKTPNEVANRKNNTLNWVKGEDGVIRAVLGDPDAAWGKPVRTYTWQDKEADNTYNYYEIAKKAEDAAKEGDGKIDWSKYDIKRRPEFGGIFGIAGPLTALGMMAANVGRPKPVNIAPVSPVLTNYQPVGNYLRYDPMNVFAPQVANNAKGLSTERYIRNNTGPLGAQWSAMIANNYAGQLANGELGQKTYLANAQTRGASTAHNAGIDQYNAKAHDATAQHNAATLNEFSKWYATADLQRQMYDAENRANWYNSLYGNIGSLSKALYNWDLNNERHNMITDMAINEVFGPFDPDSPMGRRILKRRDNIG